MRLCTHGIPVHCSHISLILPSSLSDSWHVVVDKQAMYNIFMSDAKGKMTSQNCGHVRIDLADSDGPTAPRPDLVVPRHHGHTSSEHEKGVGNVYIISTCFLHYDNVSAIRRDCIWLNSKTLVHHQFWFCSENSICIDIGLEDGRFWSYWLSVWGHVVQ